MKIIISPAKKMKIETDVIDSMTAPIFIENAKILKDKISSMDIKELQNLLRANESITEENYQRYQRMDFAKILTPAILAYDGIQYKYMAPAVFENSYFSYVQKHLRILSALYGTLKPLDGVTSYRLEMQAKLQTKHGKNMYEFWGDKIYKSEFENEDVIIDLASKEYSKSIKKFTSKTQKWITVTFGEIQNDKIVEKGVYVKMARGEMVRFMAENSIKNHEDIKRFNRLGYAYSTAHSTENKYVFIKENKK